MQQPSPDDQIPAVNIIQSPLAYSKNNSWYLAGLDGLRGMVVLLILVYHGTYHFFAGGWIGVDLFFVLSGYLITSLLQNEHSTTGKIALSKFYMRRALRLLPALFILIILANILWPISVLEPVANQRQATLAAFFYYTNLISGHISGNMAHLWSLSVEEHFYLFWPVIASLFFFKANFKGRIGVLTISIIAISVLRILTFHYDLYLIPGVLKISYYHFTFCRIDAILMGVILSVILGNEDFKSALKKYKTATVISTILLILFFIWVVLNINFQNPWWCNGGFIVTNLACAIAVLIIIVNPDHYLISNKVLHWLGKRSYGIYLYHFPIFLAFEGLKQPHNPANYLLVTLLRFGTTLIFAALSYSFLEKPILRFKKRFENSHSQRQ